MTPIAIGLTLAILIPATFVGGLARLVYLFFAGQWLSAGLFGDIGLIYFPNLMQGLISGGLSLYLVSRIVKKANIETTAYAVSAAVIVLAVIGGVVGLAPRGVEIQIVGLVAFTIGVVAGLFLVAKSITEERARVSSVTH